MRIILIAFYTLVFLLAWWPWNALIVLIAIRRAWQLHLPKHFGDSRCSGSSTRRRIEGSECLQETTIAPKQLNAFRQNSWIVRYQHLPDPLRQLLIDRQLSPRRPESERSS